MTRNFDAVVKDNEPYRILTLYVVFEQHQDDNGVSMQPASYWVDAEPALQDAAERTNDYVASFVEEWRYNRQGTSARVRIESDRVWSEPATDPDYEKYLELKARYE